jgi:hypothetical protein
MTAPNPFSHRKFILCQISDLDTNYTIEPPLLCDAHTASNKLQVQVWYPETEQYTCEEVSPQNLGEIFSFMQVVTSNSDDPNYGALLASFHNKGVIQRLAWWYSRREFLDWGAFSLFSQDSRNVDIVDLYNGPAIVTAEQRYSFSLTTAKKNIGLTEEHDALDLLKRLTL